MPESFNNKSSSKSVFDARVFNRLKYCSEYCSKFSKEVADETIIILKIQIDDLNATFNE